MAITTRSGVVAQNLCSPPPSLNSCYTSCIRIWVRLQPEAMGYGSKSCPTSPDLGVTQNGVVEQNAEEHQAQRDNLGPSQGLEAQDLLGGGLASGG
jgi:hypothetical protein